MLNFLEIRIRLIRIKYLITVHYRHEVFSVAEVDNVVRISRQHVDALDVVARYFEFDYFIGAEPTLLDEAVTADHNEELPLGVVPVLTLGYTGLGDVDADLAAIQGVHQLGEGATVVNVHLQREGHFLLGQVTQVGAVEFLGEAI